MRNYLNTYELTLEENIALIPERFYKYSSVSENFKTNLANGQLWFSSPSNFNDPFDCKAYIDFGSSEDECRLNFEKFNKAFDVILPELYSKIWNDLLKKPDDFNLLNSYSASKNFEEWLGVSCFSEKFNNSLMWAHYADKHKGVVLEFKKDLDGFLTQNLLPVNYFKSYPIIRVSDFKQEQMISIAYQVICAKGYEWKYEKEWRAIAVPGNKLYNYNKNELTGIIFGLNTEDHIIQEIVNIINSSGYKNVKFRQAEFKERQFRMRYVKIGI